MKFHLGDYLPALNRRAVLSERITVYSFLWVKDMPLTVKEEDDKFKYRLEGSFSHIPPLLSFLYKLIRVSKDTL